MHLTYINPFPLFYFINGSVELIIQTGSFKNRNGCRYDLFYDKPIPRYYKLVKYENHNGKTTSLVGLVLHLKLTNYIVKK